ncbi:MAG: hypothetical protein LAO04_03165 [Acidobacteriia bacterium]|nr:hypothetical protein [Terriglobia bacterium]
MRVEEKLPEEVQDALRKGLLKRLPMTFLPYVNQQLREWDYLFPNERQSVLRLLLYVEGLNQEQCSDLFRDVVQLEEKMGVRHWQFSTSEQTILNASLLARSPYYQEWRRAVQAVFDAAEQHALRTNGAAVKSRNRLVLLVIPRPLPVDPASVWRRWQGVGRPLKLDLALSGESPSPLETLLAGIPSAAGGRSGGLLDVALRRPDAPPANAWVVDAGTSLVDHVLKPEPTRTTADQAILLSYWRLAPYRESFSREMNTMRKDLADADAVYDRLRKVDVTPWCPPEVASQPAIREFLRSLFLSGNGAVIFGNSFVEWAASEALRRARPSFLAAQFGVRSKPKPFTGVALFDNPDQINPLPAVDDLPGSAVDAEMLALYVWLAALRFEEYQRSTVCVCLAESLSEAYVVAPQEFALGHETAPVTLDRLAADLRAWIA